MPAGDFTPQLSEPSLILQEAGLRALAASVPAFYQRSSWQLLYSSSRDGISINTFFRKAEKRWGAGGSVCAGRRLLGCSVLPLASCSGRRKL
jgi:hypothetical protein